MCLQTDLTAKPFNLSYLMLGTNAVNRINSSRAAAPSSFKS